MASLFKNPKKWFKSAGNKIKQTVKGAGKIAASPYKLVAKTVGKVVPGVADSYGAIGDAVQGKSLKKVAKKFGKGVKASAPTALALLTTAGVSAGAVVGAAGGGLDKLTGGALGKAGKFANNIADKLGDVKDTIDNVKNTVSTVKGKLGEFGLDSDNDQSPVSSSTQNPFANNESPAMASDEPPQRAGMDPKMLLIAGGALLGIILLTRKR